MKVPLFTWLGAVFWCVCRVVRGVFYDGMEMAIGVWETPSVGSHTGPPLVTGRVAFFERRMYREFKDCWNRPVAGEPGPRIAVIDPTGVAKMCINLGSYNYLGFGGYDSVCTEAAIDALTQGVGSSAEAGISGLESALERQIAQFVGKPAALVLSMGFSTNSSGMPALIDAFGEGERVLILSDELNHRSIVEGARASRAHIRCFSHNNMAELELQLVAASLEDWLEVWIVVEGIYSMEGDYCPLPEIVALKQRHGAHIYLDEAHSIGAVGSTGRGVPERFGVDPADVDVLVGTFSKSFSSVGGYVAASADIIAQVRACGFASVYGTTMAPACVKQVSMALRVLQTPDGADRLSRLRRNCLQLRTALTSMGAWILGEADSPVVPMMLCHGGKTITFSRECLAEGLAIVIVGPPATQLTLCRARFCVSAAHTPEDLIEAARIIKHVASRLGLLGIGPSTPARPISPTHSAYPTDPAKPVIRLDEACLVESGDAALDRNLRETFSSSSSLYDLRRLDVLGMARDSMVLSAASAALRIYGCGTCGPRGFYGTTDAHLDLEAELARFLRRDRAIIYPHGSAVMSSVLQAFVGRRDTVFADETIGPFTRNGLSLSGADLVLFHNVEELETKLQRHRSTGRIFLVVEAFGSTGRLCPLPDLVRLRDCFGCHLVVDESLSFGVLGDTGRGIEEHFRLVPGSIDLQVGSLEVALGCVGGFCAGNVSLIEHQRLSGSGYCFSASAPAFTVVAASMALSLLERRPLALRRVAASLNDQLCGKLATIQDLRLHGHSTAPIKFLTWTDDPIIASGVLERIALSAATKGVALQPVRNSRLHALVTPTLRLAVSWNMTCEDIAYIVEAIVSAVSVAVPDHSNP
jgi:serine palmitoyltransferase